MEKETPTALEHVERENRQEIFRENDIPAVTWRYYDRIEPGEYTGYCTTTRIYYDPAYKRHTCLLLWDVISPAGDVIAHIRMWLNLGSKKKPWAGRRSRYFGEWIKSNGGEPPSRVDRLSPRIFQHRMARILVADTASQVPYSIVREIASWETGLTRRRRESHSNTQPLHHSRQASVKGSASRGLDNEHVKSSVLAGTEGTNQPNTQGRGDLNHHPAKAYLPASTNVAGERMAAPKNAT